MAIPVLAKIAAKLATTEDGRKTLLLVILIPIIIITMLVNLVSYIISQPFSALADIFGNNLAAVESIWGKFNNTTNTGFIYYSQYDKTWSKEPYSGGNIASHGCGPTSFAMVASTFSQNKKYDPSYMAKWFTKQGYAHPSSGSYWIYDKAATAMTQTFKGDGINCELSCQQTSSWETVKQKMTDAQGSSLTIVRVQGGKWTNGSGHFMVIRGFDENGKVYVADPASSFKSGQVHEEKDIKDFAAQYWIITGPAFAFAGGGDGTYAWPVPGHSRISSPFGMRRHPVTGQVKLHDGIDIPAPSGIPIIASVSGTVATAANVRAWGNCVTIQSGNGIMCRYAHMSRMAVSVGQAVTQGTVIGYVGTTGWSTGNHLHFGIYINGSAVDPQKYIGKDTGLGGGSGGGGSGGGGSGGTLISTFKATFYDDCRKCQEGWVGTTAIGVKPTAGRTIAVDPKKIKLRSKIRLEFLDSRLSKYNGVYYAEDTGGAIKGNKIDVFVASHAEGNAAGVGQVKIYLMK